MSQDSGTRPERNDPVDEPTGEEDWEAAAQEWLLELRREERSLAPWLTLERIGEERRIRRG